MLQIYKFIVDKKTKGRSFMLFFCLMLATTVSLAQNGAKITIKKNSISVIEALKEVERQSGMSVGYNDSQLKNKPAITLNIEAASLENALAQILKGTGFTYQLKEKYIMIIPQSKVEVESKKLSADQVRQVIQLILWKLESLRQWEKERITGCIQAVVEALELKLRDAMPLMFAAITGQASSVSVLDAMEILGPDLTRYRLRQAPDLLGGVSKKENKEWEKLLGAIA